MSDVTPITDAERETAKRHFMPGVMRECGGIMLSGSVMQAYEARLAAAEAEVERLKSALESHENDEALNVAYELGFQMGAKAARAALKEE